jgi:hypothetical protein
LVGQFEDLRDFTGGPRENDQLRRTLEIGGIVAIADEILFGGARMLLTTNGLDLFDHLFTQTRRLIWLRHGSHLQTSSS